MRGKARVFCEMFAQIKFSIECSKIVTSENTIVWII